MTLMYWGHWWQWQWQRWWLWCWWQWRWWWWQWLIAGGETKHHKESGSWGNFYKPWGEMFIELSELWWWSWWRWCRRLDKLTIHKIHLQVKRITIQDSVGDMLQNEKGWEDQSSFKNLDLTPHTMLDLTPHHNIRDLIFQNILDLTHLRLITWYTSILHLTHCNTLNHTHRTMFDFTHQFATKKIGLTHHNMLHIEKGW